jgi:hypothetical protein
MQVQFLSALELNKGDTSSPSYSARTTRYWLARAIFAFTFTLAFPVTPCTPALRLGLVLDRFAIRIQKHLGAVFATPTWHSTFILVHFLTRRRQRFSVRAQWGQLVFGNDDGRGI